MLGRLLMRLGPFGNPQMPFLSLSGCRWVFPALAQDTPSTAPHFGMAPGMEGGRGWGDPKVLGFV